MECIASNIILKGFLFMAIFQLKKGEFVKMKESLLYQNKIRIHRKTRTNHKNSLKIILKQQMHNILCAGRQTVIYLIKASVFVPEKHF